MAFLQVIFPSDGAQVEDFRILRQRHDDAIDVGQLIAGGVDGVIIGIALQYPGRGVDRAGCPPRSQRRHVDVERPVLLEVDQLDPVLIAFLLGDLVDRLGRGVLRQELLEVVLRRVGPEGVALALAHRLAATDLRVAGEQVVEQEIRIIEGELHGRFVDLDDFARLAVDAHVGDRRRHDVLVAVEILEPEDKVICRERRTVRPLHALAQVDGVELSVGAHIDAFGDAGDDLGAGVVPEQKLVGGIDAVAVLDVAGTGEAAPPGAAVFSNGMDRLHDHRLAGDAILDRGQLALLDQFGQLRRFLEGFGDGGRVAHHDGAFRLTNKS